MSIALDLDGSSRATSVDCQEVASIAVDIFTSDNCPTSTWARGEKGTCMYPNRCTIKSLMHDGVVPGCLRHGLCRFLDRFVTWGGMRDISISPIRRWLSD